MSVYTNIASLLCLRNKYSETVIPFMVYLCFCGVWRLPFEVCYTRTWSEEKDPMNAEGNRFIYIYFFFKISGQNHLPVKR